MKHTDRVIARREAARRLVVLVAAALVAPRNAAAGGAKLDPQGERARKFGYAHDAASTSRPSEAQSCSRCTHFTPVGDGACGTCNIFPGSEVDAGGWCSAFYARG